MKRAPTSNVPLRTRRNGVNKWMAAPQPPTRTYVKQDLTEHQIHQNILTMTEKDLGVGCATLRGPAAWSGSWESGFAKVVEAVSVQKQPGDTHGQKLCNCRWDSSLGLSGGAEQLLIRVSGCEALQKIITNSPCCELCIHVPHRVFHQNVSAHVTWPKSTHLKLDTNHHRRRRRVALPGSSATQCAKSR